MRKLFLVIASLPVIFSFGCKKESSSHTTSTPPALVTLPVTLSSNKMIGGVNAGNDIYIDLPKNSCWLKGSVQYPENLHAVSWSKISGSSSGEIENPRSLETRLYNLTKGTYKYELSIIDKANVATKDTVSVIVSEAGTGLNELIFSNLKWVCPMGCHLPIENFPFYIPSHTSFRVFVKRNNSIEWTEAFEIHKSFSKYMWTIYNNRLEILEDQSEQDLNDTPDVKIIF